MIDTVFAERFAHEWVEAWNSHDLEAVLSHYSDDLEMSSRLSSHSVLNRVGRSEVKKR